MADVQFIAARKHRVPVAVLVVKSRLLDVLHSLETTPEENLLMARETSPTSGPGAGGDSRL